MAMNCNMTRCTNLIRLLLLCSVITLTTQEVHVPAGIQTGPDLSGSSFASSVTYDAHSHSIIVTGSTFGRYFSKTTTSAVTDTTPRLTSNCFVATIVLPDDELNFYGSSGTAKLQWSTKQVLGGTEEDKVQEACTLALYHPQNKEKLFVLGYSETGGTFDPLYDSAALDPVKHYGVLLDIDILSSSLSLSATTPYRIVGGRAIQEYSVSYPITAAIQNEYVYVVSQETDTMTRPDGDTSNQFVDDNTNATFDINNEVDPMRYFKYGDKYRMSIRQYRSYPLNHNSNPSDFSDEYKETFEEGWYEKFLAESITKSSNGKNITTSESAHVSGLAIVNDDIFMVVGSTSGDGAAFGRSSSTDSTMFDDNTLHGFVTKFYIANGTVVPELDDDKGNVQIKGSRRIQSSAEGGRVWVAGMCNHMTKEPNAFYIVGATEGRILTDNAKFASGSSSDTENGVDAYVMKIDVTTLEEIWVQQITGIDAGSMVRGISCAVATNEDAIWVGGVVQDDGVIIHADTISSFGGDDVFIVKMNSNNGEHLLTHQIGSSEDDGLAMRGGIALDRDDNCIVVGSTYGSMYRVRAEDEVGADDDADNRIWISDVFVTTISKSGSISYPISHPEFVPQPGSGSTGEEVDATAPDIEKSSSGVKTSTIVVMMLLFLICGSLAIALYIRTRSKRNRDASTDRSKVILFLNEFDVDDIDLKHSATGGWHCSYSNDLANGHNRRALEQHRTPSFGGLSPLPGDRSKRSSLGSDPLLTAPLTSRSLIKESLFMNDDDDDKSDNNDDNSRNLSGGDRFTESKSTKQRPGYSGLLDEYNSGWNDRQYDGPQSNDAWGKEIL